MRGKLLKVSKFGVLSFLTSLLFVYLFVTLTFYPESFGSDVGLEAHESAFIIGRRAAVIFFGLAVLTFFGGRAPASPARQAICLGVGCVMLGLAIMGTYELIRGALGIAIIQAIIIESVVAFFYFGSWFLNRTTVR